MLGPLAEGAGPVAGAVGTTDGSPVRVVPARAWQAARSTGAYTLVACIVGPGFDFADFELMEAGGELAQRVGREHPEVRDLV